VNVESFEIWNFKSIEYSGVISFPKITVLIGANSTGKSSILQSLLLMKQTMEAEEPSVPLVLNGPSIQLGEYRDFIYRKEIRRPFIIKFNFEKHSGEEHICEICGKIYTRWGWFLKHIKKEHPKYWQKKREMISTKEYFLSRKQSLKLKYEFNSKTGGIILRELELENPEPYHGLMLSSLKIKQLANCIRLTATSLSGKQIYTKEQKIPKAMEVLNYGDMVRYFSRRGVDSFLLSFGPSTKESEEISLLEEDLGDVLDYQELDKLGMGDTIWFFLRNDQNVIQWYRSLNKKEKLAMGLLSRLNHTIRVMNSRFSDLRLFLQGIRHIGPLRNWPERIYFSTGGKPNTVGLKGEFTQDIIWRDKRIGHESLIKSINEWLKKIKLNCEIEVVPLGVGEIYQLRVKENDISVNLADVGFGLSQVLPIVTECINFSISGIEKKTRLGGKTYIPYLGEEKIEVNRLLLIEQPEIHLNPKIQAELGDFFVKIAKRNRALLIETHSEHIISRIQRRVVDGLLKPEDVVIYFFSKHDTINKSKIKKISILPTGAFSYWPDGFFQEDYEDAIEILKESLKKQSSG